MKHSALGVSIFVAGMMAANAANAQFAVSGQPALERVLGGGPFTAGFNGTLADDFGFWLSSPDAVLEIRPGRILESRATRQFAPEEITSVAIGKYVFSPSNQGLQGFTVDFDVTLFTPDTFATFDLFGGNGPREKFSVSNSAQSGEPHGHIQFIARSHLGDTLAMVSTPVTASITGERLHVSIEYSHSVNPSVPGTIRFRLTTVSTGESVALQVNRTITQPFRISLGSDGAQVPATPRVEWRNLITNLQIPDHLRGSPSPLIQNGTILFDRLPLGFSGVTFVDPPSAATVFGGNFLAGAPDSLGTVRTPSAPTANYHAMVIETLPGLLFPGPGAARQTLFTTSSLPGESAWPSDLGAVNVVAFFPNCFIAPNTALNLHPTQYLWRGECLAPPASGLDLAASGWMAAPRPGFARKTYVYVSNMGGQMNGLTDTLTIAIPQEFTNATIEAPSGISCQPTPPVSPEAFTCSLPQVGVNLHLTFVLAYTVSPAVTVGTPLEVVAELFINSGTDDNTDNNRFVISATVQGAVDPNDKLAIPEAGPIVPGELLHYVVRFENVGTLATEKIIITDALDPNLDRASVAFISDRGVYDPAGHSISWLLETPLDPGKQGFVEFWARARADLRPGDTITNRASIQFDFNAPIVTAPVVHFIPVVGLPQPQDTVDCLKDLLTHSGLRHNHQARHEVVKAIKDVLRAIRKHAHGDLEEALERIDDAVQHLQKATKHGADLSSCQPLAKLWAWALDQVDQRIAAAVAASGEKNKNVKKAREERADAVAAQARGNWHKAFEELIDASRYAGKALPQPGHKGDGKRADRD